MGTILEIATTLAGVGVTLTVWSYIFDLLTKKRNLLRKKNLSDRPEASVSIEMPNGEKVQFRMPVEEAERLTHQ